MPRKVYFCHLVDSDLCYIVILHNHKHLLFRSKVRSFHLPRGIDKSFKFPHDVASLFFLTKTPV